MNAADWIQLWILNRLTCHSSQLSQLIYNPLDERGAPYWAFPGRAFFSACAENRIEAITTCVKEGWIEIFPHSWLLDKQFRSINSCGFDDCQFHDPQFLETSEAVLSFSGHERWEAEFQPDWKRFWLQVPSARDYEEKPGERILSILYTSDEMLDALMRHSTYIGGLDEEVPLVELDLQTEFQYAATMWKTIHVVKVITWKGFDELVTFNQMPTQGQKNRFLATQKERHRKARGILCRLSKKWRAVRASERNRQDADPEEMA